LLVPRGTGDAGQTALASLPPEKRLRWARHRVERGETLSQIASHYRTSVGAIAEANKLRSTHFLSVGQTLLVPHGPAASHFASSAPERSASRAKSTHVVRKGDTLSQIAEKYGTSVSNLKRWNQLGPYIRPGQRLTIYGGSGSSRSESSDHTVVKVRRGDTLWDIARHYGVTLSALLHANNLSRADLIRPGDLIRVPRRAG
jgi:membrane-bound lytic murein transglycosylase D